MAHVHKHAGLFGVAHLRPELAVRIQQPAWMSSEHVGYDISLPQILEHVTDRWRCCVFGPALADVDQERDLQIVAELSRPPQRLQALCSQGAARGHDLYADDDVPISLHGLFDFIFVDEARVGEDAITGPGHTAQRGKIDVVQHARLGDCRNMLAKYSEETMA